MSVAKTTRKTAYSLGHAAAVVVFVEICSALSADVSSGGSSSSGVLDNGTMTAESVSMQTGKSAVVSRGDALDKSSAAGDQLSV